MRSLPCEAGAAAGLPPATRPKPCAEDIEDIWKLHERACQRGEDFYKDPATGYMVFTRVAHERRGKCCGNGCRHCPYDHANVRSDRLAQRIQQPAFLHVGERERQRSAGVDKADGGVVVLFWSSGKDSFMTLRSLARSGREVVLMTTFCAATRVIANQEVDASEVERQARHLDVSVVGVPLHPGVEYVERLRAGLEVVRKRRPVSALAFGDLYLEHIRSWREDRLSAVHLGVPELLFPLWRASYDELHRDLEASGVPCEISALGPNVEPKGELRVGTQFSRALADEVAGYGMDRFGENGEFHTLAKVWEVPAVQAMGL
mmetsp:Transcript_22177/g.62422  ORF Transcript_22177/g.62422 Transcript_22177/m.62422 type:complete len:318 (+) Transcript_22177:2-955(+)